MIDVCVGSNLRMQKGKWEERIKMEDEDDLEDLIEEKGAVPSGMCYVEFPG